MNRTIVTKRFTKGACLAALDARAEAIATREAFNRDNGTSQLNPKARMSDEDVRRAVEYGRMRAFEEFACAIEEGRLEVREVTR